MTDIKNQAQGLDANLSARDIALISSKTSNIYRALTVISKRSRQLANEMREELHQKLEEFATVSDTIEEVHENKEQIEISKFYERLPSPTIIALNEFLNDQLDYRTLGDDDESEEDEDMDS
jgi:DNA-directed RNA polymerase subunit K/omega